MQVTHQHEHVTHAVITNHQAIDFGISSSAEFFNILSSTLYKDQILAVTREVLCNAWDAHIEAGCTDKPVEITLSKDQLIIKDFGKGIHHDDMGTIYGTYGNSTKKNDGQQTGGFGLGCKAPFAYTDHFEVISCHDGVKTIYNLSKSSAQVQGKPGIIPIASFPTTESGLTVTIRIKNDEDYRRYMILVRRIARNGDMNMTMNGTELKKLGFDTSKGNYLLTKEEVMDSWHRVLVRYGNVIYPVERSNEISDNYDRICAHLDTISVHYSRYCIIFQAPPHSISVTPSRESLSMQEHTVKTLNTLFEGYINMLDTVFIKECNTYAYASVQEAVKESNVQDLLCHPVQLPTASKVEEIGNISDIQNLVKKYMARNYPNLLTFRKQNIKYRLELMAKAKLIDLGHSQTFIRALEEVSVNFDGRWHKYEKNDWLKRRVISPLLAKLYKAGMDTNRLFVCDPTDQNTPTDYYGNSKGCLVKAINSCPRHLFNTLPYLRNIVVLASNKSTMVDRAFQHEVFNKLGKEYGFLFYHVGMKASDKEEAVKFFNNTGMKVVDLTFRQEYDPEPEKKDKNVTKKAKKGNVALSSLLYTNYSGDGVDIYKYGREDNVIIDNPEAVVQISLRTNNTNKLGHWGTWSSKEIVKLFGDKVAVTNTSTTYDKLINKGVKPLDEYVLDKLLQYMKSSTTLKNYWAFDKQTFRDELEHFNDVSALVDILFDEDKLGKHFKMFNPLSDLDKQYLEIYKGANNAWQLMTKDQMKELKGIYDNISLDKTCLDLIKKIDKNNYLRYLDIHTIKRKTGTSEEKHAFDFLIEVLNK